MNEIEPHLQKTQLGIEVCYAAPLCYLLGWISGIAMLFLEPKNPYVRFHAAQSAVWFGALTLLATVVGWVPILGQLAGALIGLVGLGSWAFLMYRAWDDSRGGDAFELPVAAELARKVLAAWES